MISEIIEDLEKIQNKVKLNITLYPNNDIWHKLYGELETIISEVKIDKRMFRYD